MAAPIQLNTTGLQRYFNNATHSDVTIHLKDRSIKAHRVVLVLSAEFFRGALEGSFKETNTATISLTDDDPEAAAGMLRHFYGLKPHDAARKPGVYFDLKLVIIAEKYNVPGLVRGSVVHVKEHLEQRWQDENFPQLVRDIYENLPPLLEQDDGLDDLSTVAKNVCKANIKTLLLKKSFKEMLLEMPELAVNLLKDVVG